MRALLLDLDPALRIVVLSPPEKRFGDDLNTNSIVLRISYGTINFLFTGDAGGEAETALEEVGRQALADGKYYTGFFSLIARRVR